MTVTAPLRDTFTKGPVRVTATCADDVACSAILVNGTRYAGASIDTTVMVKLPYADATKLAIAGEDVAGAGPAAEVPIYVDNSPKLIEVGVTPGTIFDYDGARAVHAFDWSALTLEGRPRSASLRTFASGADTSLTTLGPDLLSGVLTQNGAVALATNNKAWELAGSTVTTREHVTRAKVAGKYVAYQLRIPRSGGETFDEAVSLRDVTTGVELYRSPIPTPPAPSVAIYDFAVSPAGELAWFRNDHMVGSPAVFMRCTPAAGLTTGHNTYPRVPSGLVIDGANVVWVQQSLGQREIKLLSGGVLTDLCVTGSVSSGHCRSVRASNGWIAWEEDHAALGEPNKSEVWLRSPTGEKKKVSTLPGSLVEALSPTGEVMIVNDRRRSVASFDKPQVDVAGALGAVKWIGGEWYEHVGRSALRIGDGEAGPPDASAPDTAEPTDTGEATDAVVAMDAPIVADTSVADSASSSETDTGAESAPGDEAEDTGCSLARGARPHGAVWLAALGLMLLRARRRR